MWMDNKRGTAQSTLCVDNRKDKTELEAMCDWHLKKKKKKKKKNLEISWIPFQVGNSANSATFPRSRKITGPTKMISNNATGPKFVISKNSKVVQ